MPEHAIIDNPFGDNTVAVYTRTVILTNAQIQSLPTSVIEIIPATEDLNYEDMPTKLIVPIAARAVLNKLGGGYSNNDTAPYLVLAWGSDWSMAVSNQASIAGSIINQAGVVALIPFEIAVSTINALNGALKDNALVIAGSNGSLGDLLGGHPDNTLEVTVEYCIKVF